MCIFCGGTCGGVGDVIIPSVAAGASLVTLKIQAMRQSRKQKAGQDSAPEKDDTGDGPQDS